MYYGHTDRRERIYLRICSHWIGFDLWSRYCCRRYAVRVCLHVQTIVVERNDLLARFGGFTLTFLDQVSRQMPSLKLQ